MDMKQYDAGNEIKDIETGILEPTLRPRTDVTSLSQRTTETELESITSLGVVSSAAGAGADTLNVLALAVANLIIGLVIIFHNLPTSRKTGIKCCGTGQNFVLHAVVTILSFLVFGLDPPVVYGFSFRKSDDKDLKLAAVAGASLICIFLLALGRGHVRRPHRTYFLSLSYYIGLGITASCISYVVGQLLKKLLEQLGLFESTVGLPLLETVSMEVGSASY
ncbi:NOD26-like intrinsic protein 5,1 [Hibiscus syriacus]|uniref:NOD26-like intrinsic protein 5,1 n=1 Tax=Hibiscus syriacus TaxID=106335 RepID=A0A6A3CDS2_HIBSY|nr:NOD26-like intrinsic protein 5,1 [Hibiscus syriacus]